MALSRAPVNPAMVPHFMRMDRMTAVPSEVSMARPTRSMCTLHAMVPRGCENCMFPISSHEGKVDSVVPPRRC